MTDCSAAQRWQWQQTAEGQQVGAMAHGAALPPVLPFGLHMDEHFELARLDLDLHPALMTSFLACRQLAQRHGTEFSRPSLAARSHVLRFWKAQGRVTPGSERATPREGR